MSGRALYVTISFGVLDISCVDHLPDELVAITLQGLSFSGALGIGPEGTFQRMQLSVQSLQIDDQLPSSRSDKTTASICFTFCASALRN